LFYSSEPRSLASSISALISPTTTTHTAHLKSFHVLLHITMAHDWDAQQFDVKTAYLNGVLPRMRSSSWNSQMDSWHLVRSPGCENSAKNCMVCVSGHIWNKQLHGVMLNWGFTHLMCEWCIYYHTTSEGTVLIAVHIDDILSVASSKEENSCFKSSFIPNGPSWIWVTSSLLLASVSQIIGPHAPLH